jgi:hypothetical protein
MDINIQDDLNSVNEQLTQMVDQLNTINGQREQLIQQVQNLNGVAMYLRGKMPPEEAAEIDEVETETSVERTDEYPVTAE